MRLCQMIGAGRDGIVIQRSEKALYLRDVGETSALPKMAEIDLYRERWRICEPLRALIGRGSYDF
eukprot:8997473-Alexandrium_andersonii.AAC.1